MGEYDAILWCLFAVTFLLYYYCTSTYNFWKIRGVPGPKPIPFLGNAARIATRSISIGAFAKELYDKYKKEPIAGVFMMRTPTVLVNDPELIKNILIKDFLKFSDRGFRLKEKKHPLSQALFALDVKQWRPLRAKLSPAFTSRKLKDMFVMILKRAEMLEMHLTNFVRKEERIDIRDATDRFTLDVIGDCAYGVDAKAMEHENSEFQEMGKHIFERTSRFQTRFAIQKMMPSLGNLFDYIFPDEGVEKFFYGLFWNTTEYRKKNNIVKQDFINALMEIREQALQEDIGLSETMIAAQTFVFFVAGSETSSSTTCNALYELAIHQHMQDKLREEINEHYEKNGKLTNYEEIRKMKYLDLVFRETLRKYPPLQVMHRQATSDYTFEGLNVTVPAGINLWISTYGIHRDPNIYPDPDKFDPDRFQDEEVQKRHPMHYLPFGDGPRNCIGRQFTTYQIKITLIKLLRSLKFDVCKETEIPYIIDKQNFLLGPKNKIYLKISKI